MTLLDHGTWFVYYCLHGNGQVWRLWIAVDEMEDTTAYQDILFSPWPSLLDVS